MNFNKGYSDDYIAKDYLKILYSTAEKYESDMVVSGQYKVDEEGKMIDCISYHPDKNGNSIVRRLNISGKIYKRKFIEAYGINFPSGKTYEDNPFNIAAYFLSENLRFLIENYAKNKYCRLFSNKSIQLKQKLGVRVFGVLVRTNILKLFTKMYYYL